MTQIFRYQNFLVENFRSFEKFKIEELSDINIIGGENGTGKSSLLEAAFHLADRALRYPLIFEKTAKMRTKSVN